MAEQVQEKSNTPAQQPGIALTLQSDFLTFSKYNTEQYKAYVESVRKLDYGVYTPTTAITILKPLPPLGLKTPMEYEKKEAELRKLRAQKAQSQIAEIENTEKQSFWSTMKKALVKANVMIEEMSEDFSDATNETFNRAPRRCFNELFLPKEEQLVYDFYCSMVTGDTTATGSIFVTTNFLVFTGTKRDEPPLERSAGPGRNRSALRVTIPIAEIVSFHRAIKKLSKNSPFPTFVATGMGQEAMSDAVMIYTADGKIHVFYDFIRIMQSFYTDFLAVLDYTWRGMADEKKEEPKGEESKKEELKKEESSSNIPEATSALSSATTDVAEIESNKPADDSKAAASTLSSEEKEHKEMEKEKESGASE